HPDPRPAVATGATSRHVEHHGRALFVDPAELGDHGGPGVRGPPGRDARDPDLPDQRRAQAPREPVSPDEGGGRAEHRRAWRGTGPAAPRGTATRNPSVTGTRSTSGPGGWGSSSSSGSGSGSSSSSSASGSPTPCNSAPSRATPTRWGSGNSRPEGSGRASWG